ncbi:MAG TPA: extracellular solute-binding protein [Solirubrobacterales bacterium]|nr:extracellular solute-binding protein [Solirubrobacterales bacterium]
MKSTTRWGCALAFLVIAGGLLAACGGSGGGGGTSSSGGSGKEVVITCESCPTTAPKDDPFSVFYKEMWEAFNEKYKGTYRIEPKPFKPTSDEESAEHFEREAATGTLSDLFTDQSNVIRSAAEAGTVLNIAPFLEEDSAWKESFVPEAFASASNEAGEIFGVPEETDSIGIYYNKGLFAKAGIGSFPTTWEQLLEDCSKLKASGTIPFAMDGDWVTQLMWTNLIGTQPGGEKFLKHEISEGNYADNPIVVKATEFLKQMHTEGCVNSDAFSGNYESAAAPFLAGEAAMIANGPWMTSEIAAEGTKEVGYERSPGDGLIVVTGSAVWASGAHDSESEEAVIAFMKFLTSEEEMFTKAVKTGSYWPIEFTPSASQVKKLDPLSYKLVSETPEVKYTYPNSKFDTSQQFSTEWINDWPAYVQGGMSTEEFLDALSAAQEKQ